MVIQNINHLLSLINKLNKHTFKCALSLLLLSVSSSSFAITALKAEVNINPAMVGESFNLIITAQNHNNVNSITSSKLLRNFVVGRTATSKSYKNVNGVTTQQISWTITLMSRKEGLFTIPAFTIDNVSSKPIVMKIIERPAASQASEDVKLETSINTESAYVGQRLIYTIKLLISTRLQRANLQPPQLAGAEIKQISDAKESSEIINGKRYRSVVYEYEIQPSQTGRFELQGAMFQGDISQYGYGRSTPITLIGDNHQIEIKSIPPNFPGQWLVSDMVILEDSWSDAADYQVGEPITRTLTLSAANVSTEQLPNLTIETGPLLQSYPDKPVLQQGLNGNILFSQAIQKIALIPSKSGKLTLPEVKIPWFNARTEKIEWATIAQKTITVSPQAGSNLATNKPVQADQPVTPVVPTPITDSPTINTEKMILWYIIIALLSALLLVALFYILWLRKKDVKIKHKDVKKTSKSNSNIYDRLLESLNKNEISNVVRLLPLWLKQDYQMNVDDKLPLEFGITKSYHKLVKQQFSQNIESVNCQELKKNVVDFNNKKFDEAIPLSGLYASRK